MIYVDDFTHNNSNGYWLDAFRKYSSNVLRCDVIAKKPNQILKEILINEPSHIHFGGSIKSEKRFPYKYIHDIRKNLPKTKITFFYGDAYNLNYHRNIIRYIDKLFITHKPNDIKNKIEYIPCPTSLDSENSENKKIYEVSFIGNNYSEYRLNDLKKISKICDLTVIGNNWENTGLKFKKSISYKNFPEVVSKSKFCLGSTLYVPCEWNSLCGVNTRLCHDKTCSKYEHKYGYFSNRVMNLCGCSGCVLHINGKGMDEIFKNEFNILLFNSIEHLKDMIKTFNINDTTKIGKNAYNLSRNYTFEIIAKKIISGEKDD